MDYILISASDINHSPYIKPYIDFFKEHNISYRIIKWNKYGYESQNSDEIIFNLQYNVESNFLVKFIVYLKYMLFIVKNLKKFPNSNLIVFTIPLITFLSFFLFFKKKNKYFLDIRDYNKIYINLLFKCLYKYSCGLFISSMGFKKWLNLGDYSKVIISHNITSSMNKQNCFNRDSKILLTIGSIRDSVENARLIDTLFDYNFKIVGDGIKLNELKLKYSSYKNVKFFGMYEKKDEILFLEAVSFINSTLDFTFNNKFILTNRLYLGVQNYIPQISNDGNFQSELIKEFELGIIYTNINELPKLIEDFYIKYTFEEFKLKCDSFIKLIEKDLKQQSNILYYYANNTK
ncbi:hypothetical protein IF128_03575 [Empedobacter stercoris]|uniref:hypothetical protein n=1 Tax=Empedobacter stercoris TaxID=1628248 RepID=UPI0016622B80|nr:hypothetical protein [Empedobacter stercoris]MCA4808834.1 hypothetical protein [Empedobacter stercoris]QNT15360.1 hypothetical protein HNV03_12250 [Empedobacter stercoris]